MASNGPIADAIEVLTENDELLRSVVRDAKKAGRNTKNAVLALVDGRERLGRMLSKRSTARASSPGSHLIALAIDVAKTPPLTSTEPPGPLPDHEAGHWRIFVALWQRAGWATTPDFDHDPSLS